MNAPSELALDARVDGGPSTYRFRTADGVCSADSFRPAELALLEALWDRDPGRLLCPEANYGVVGTVLDAVSDDVCMTESSARAAAFCERNARDNGVDAAVSLCADLTGLPGRFDTVACAPKPHTPVAMARQRLADALARLRPGGRLYLAAAKRTGLNRYADCLGTLASDVDRVHTEGDHRVVRVTLPGLFSPTALDDGTRLLLAVATPADGDRVLDLCCGYGPVGAYAGRVADCELVCTDDDRVATRCAERSLDATGVDGTVVTADCLDGVDGPFDRVLCNPPTHAGDGVLAALFAGAREHLAPGGRLTFVRHRALDFAPHLRGFESVERVRTGAEHVVLRANP